MSNNVISQSELGKRQYHILGIQKSNNEYYAIIDIWQLYCNITNGNSWEMHFFFSKGFEKARKSNGFL